MSGALKRVWLVEVQLSYFRDPREGDEFLEHWYHTKKDATEAMENHRSMFNVDCPMRVVRFERRLAKDQRK